MSVMVMPVYIPLLLPRYKMLGYHADLSNLFTAVYAGLPEKKDRKKGKKIKLD